MNPKNRTEVTSSKSSLPSGVEIIMTILLLFLIYHMARQAAILTSAAPAASALSTSPVVAIDSGHGGGCYRQK